MIPTDIARIYKCTPLLAYNPPRELDHVYADHPLLCVPVVDTPPYARINVSIRVILVVDSKDFANSNILSGNIYIYIPKNSV